MKVLQEGTLKPWWVGITHDCPKCGRKIELEAGDQNRCDTVLTTHELTVWCPWGETNFIKKR